MPPRPTRLTNLPPELIQRIMDPADVYAVARAKATSRTVRAALQNRLAGPLTPMPGAENVRVSEPDDAHVAALAHRLALLHAWTRRAIEHYDRTVSSPHPASHRARFAIIADYWYANANGELRSMGKLLFYQWHEKPTTMLRKVTGFDGVHTQDFLHFGVEIPTGPGAHDTSLLFKIIVEDNAWLSMVQFQQGVVKIRTNEIERGHRGWSKAVDPGHAWSGMKLDVPRGKRQGIDDVRNTLRLVLLLKRALLVAFRPPVRLTFRLHWQPEPFERLFRMMGIVTE